MLHCGVFSLTSAPQTRANLCGLKSEGHTVAHMHPRQNIIRCNITCYFLLHRREKHMTV